MAKSNNSLKTKVEKVLASALKGFQSGILLSDSKERVLGYVVSSEFSGQDHAKRQARLNNVLEKALDADELLRLGPIATLSPEEAAITRKAG